MNCYRCGTEMQPGAAIGQTFVGMPDFPGDNHVCTVRSGGPGYLMSCLKCPTCGHSVAAAIAKSAMTEHCPL